MPGRLPHPILFCSKAEPSRARREATELLGILECRNIIVEGLERILTLIPDPDKHPVYIILIRGGTQLGVSGCSVGWGEGGSSFSIWVSKLFRLPLSPEEESLLSYLLSLSTVVLFGESTLNMCFGPCTIQISRGGEEGWVARVYRASPNNRESVYKGESLLQLLKTVLRELED